MRTILVDGVSGAGKSTVARRLIALGNRAVSTDGAEGLCHWVDAAGRPVDRPAAPTSAWLLAHWWVWDSVRLDTIIADARHAGATRLWLCGSAHNAPDLVDRFDQVVMLRIDRQTMLTRLDDPRRGNDFGRAGCTRGHLMDHFDDWQRQLGRRADTVIDATGDLDLVIRRLIAAGGCAPQT